MSVNKITLVGNLGKDPIIKKFDTGSIVAQFTLATNEKYKDKTGNPITKTEWHNIVVWGGQAEVAERFLKKGSQVYLEGKVETREYIDLKDNITKRITEIIVRNITLLGSQNSGLASYNNVPPPTEPENMSTSRSNVEPMMETPVLESVPDDLPF